MKISTATTILTAALATSAMAADDSNDQSNKSGLSKYILMFESGLETPQDIYNKVEEKLKELGASITYQYDTVLKGFAFSASQAVMDKFRSQEAQVQDAQYPFIVEDDKVVNANNGDEKVLGNDKKA